MGKHNRSREEKKAKVEALKAAAAEKSVACWRHSRKLSTGSTSATTSHGEDQRGSNVQGSTSATTRLLGGGEHDHGSTFATTRLVEARGEHGQGSASAKTSPRHETEVSIRSRIYFCNNKTPTCRFCRDNKSLVSKHSRTKPRDTDLR